MQMFDCKNLRDLEHELQRRNLLAEHATILHINSKYCFG